MSSGPISGRIGSEHRQAKFRAGQFGKENARFFSTAKCFAADVAMKASLDGLQVLGGAGYMKDHPLERFMRDAKQLQIVEGTNQIQRMVIARNLLDI